MRFFGIRHCTVAITRSAPPNACLPSVTEYELVPPVDYHSHPVAATDSEPRPIPNHRTIRSNALSQLYSATGGETWENNDRWMFGDPCAHNW